MKQVFLIAISEPCKAFLSLDVKEKELRNAVFNELLNRNSGLQFPRNARVKKYDYKHKTKLYYYKEKTIAEVLPQISSLIVPNSRESIMKKLENGLVVTTASTPDMIVLNPIIELLRLQQHLPETQQLYEMVQGEFKHGAAYNINIATIKCFAYLYSALYRIRVVQGFPLESVY